MNGIFMGLVVLEAVLTGAIAVMFIYLSMLGMKEENQLILDNAEAHLMRGQDSIGKKVSVLSRYLKLAGVAWGVVFVALSGLWIVTGLYTVLWAARCFMIFA